MPTDLAYLQSIFVKKNAELLKSMKTIINMLHYTQTQHAAYTNTNHPSTSPSSIT